MTSDIFQNTKWADNPSAQRIIREWFRKAEKAHGDEGNYYVRQLEDIGFVADTRSGADWGNEPLRDNQ